MQSTVYNPISPSPPTLRIRKNNRHKICINTTDCLYVTPVRDIVCLEGDGNYCIFYLANGKKIVVAKTVKYYQSLLPTDLFLRVHKKYLINIDYVRMIKKTPRCEIVFQNEMEIPVSNSCRKEVYALFNTVS